MNNIKTIAIKAFSGSYGSLVLLLVVPLAGILLGVAGYTIFHYLPNQVIGYFGTGVTVLIITAVALLILSVIISFVFGFREHSEVRLATVSVLVLAAIILVFFYYGSIAGILALIATILLLILLK